MGRDDILVPVFREQNRMLQVKTHLLFSIMEGECPATHFTYDIAIIPIRVDCDHPVRGLC
jgi:hypothetical protein